MAISWQITQSKQKHHPIWVIGSATVGLGLIAFGLWQKSFIFVILTILIIFVIYQFSRPRDRTNSFCIDEQGVWIDQTLYPYNFLKSFWIFYEPGGRQELSLESKKNIVPYLRIPLTSQNPNQVRKSLSRYLPEKEQEESLIDIIAHRLKF